MSQTKVLTFPVHFWQAVGLHWSHFFSHVIIKSHEFFPEHMSRILTPAHPLGCHLPVLCHPPLQVIAEALHLFSSLCSGPLPAVVSLQETQIIFYLNSVSLVMEGGGVLPNLGSMHLAFLPGAHHAATLESVLLAASPLGLLLLPLPLWHPNFPRPHKSTASTSCLLASSFTSCALFFLSFNQFDFF